MPQSLRARLWSLYHRAILVRPSKTPGGLPKAGRVVVAGMFRTASGLGAWARSSYHALVAAGYDVVAVDLSSALAPLDFDCDIPLSEFPLEQQGTLIIYANAPEIPSSLRKLGLRRKHDWRIIAAWAWELELFPDGWEAAFPFISEIWTLSEFAARAFRSHHNAPRVRVVPISVNPPEGLSRGGLQSARPVFRVVAMADALSSLKRKNPLGAIAAFKAAFGGDPTCHLTVKVRNLGSEDELSLELRNALAGANNITLIESSLSEADTWNLIASADVLISLHRAEGFGLSIAEAMAVGVSVVATGWSGNLQYCNDEVAALVPYELVRVRDQSRQYEGKGLIWAEPNIAEAVKLLHRLRSDSQWRQKLVVDARAQVRKVCAPEVIQALLIDCLEKPC